MEATDRAISHLEGIAARNEASQNIIHQTIAKSIRALLKAYQEQRRALERISAVMAGDVETDTLTTAVGRLNGVIAIANGATLNQKGDER